MADTRLTEAPLEDVAHTMRCVDRHCVRCAGEKPRPPRADMGFDTLATGAPTAAARARSVDRPLDVFFLMPVTLRCRFCASWVLEAVPVEEMAGTFGAHAREADHQQERGRSAG